MGNGSNGVVVDTAPVFVTAPDCHISHFIAQRCGDGGARDLLRHLRVLAVGGLAPARSRAAGARARAARRPAGSS